MFVIVSSVLSASLHPTEEELGPNPFYLKSSSSSFLFISLLSLLRVFPTLFSLPHISKILCLIWLFD